MLYTFIKIISLISIRTFFDKVTVWNDQRIPKQGPVIFVSNHPNTMMDPLVVGTSCKRELHFFAKSTLFSNRIIRFILLKLKLVPVYRRQDNPQQMGKNDRTFSKGYTILEEQGAFLIFPEGISTGDRTLEKVKTGAARIGLGAEEKNDFKLGVQIIPVGLSYSNIVKFRSDVFIRFGKPILLNKYKDQYGTDQKKVVNILRDKIEIALNKLTTNVNELEIADLVECIEMIYRKELIIDEGLQLDSKEDEFAVTKGLISAVEWYQDRYPAKVDHFRFMIASYLDQLESLNIQESYLGPSIKELTLYNRFKAIGFMLFGFPFYIFGLINNYLPYNFPRWFTKRFTRFKSEVAPYKMISGITVFIFYYTLLLLLIQGYLNNTIVTTLWGLCLIPSGNFVLSYIQRVNSYKQHLHFISMFYKKKDQVYDLIEERLKIIHFINDAKKQYYNEKPSE